MSRPPRSTAMSQPSLNTISALPACASDREVVTQAGEELFEVAEVGAGEPRPLGVVDRVLGEVRRVDDDEVEATTVEARRTDPIAAPRHPIRSLPRWTLSCAPPRR